MGRLFALAGLLLLAGTVVGRKAVPGRLDRFAGRPVRVPMGPPLHWHVWHCHGAWPADPECVLRVSEYDELGEPTADVRHLRVAQHDGAPLLLQVREIALEGRG